MTTNSKIFPPHVAGATVDIPAHDVRPGDYLPPQRALHGTPWRERGFLVGGRPEDVRGNLPVLSGKVLLFGTAGLLDSISRHAVVTVHRGES